MQANLVQIPIFVYPIPLTFYLDDQNSHKQVLTLYNPYEFAVRFRVLSNAPNKYSVVDPEGSIRPRSYVDIVVRHNAVSQANVNITDKFRVQMRNHATKQLLGKQDVPATLLPGKPVVTTPEVDDFQRLPITTITNSPVQYRDKNQVRLQTPNFVILTTAVVSIVALMMPTEGDKDSRFPEYLHVHFHLKLVCAYVLGLITMALLRT